MSRFDCPPDAAARDCVGCPRTQDCIQDLRSRQRPYQRYDRTTIKEVPIALARDMTRSPIIDAEQNQRFKLRDLK